MASCVVPHRCLGPLALLRLVDRPLSCAFIRSSDGLEHDASGWEGGEMHGGGKGVVMKRVTVGVIMIKR